MSRFPWRDTSTDIAGGQPPQWETPQGAQKKADDALKESKDYTDEQNVNFNAHIEDTTIHVTPADKANWNSKAPGVHTHANATPIAPGFMSAEDKAKLNGVEAEANKYVHPASHPPAIIAQDAANRFVTDAEKATWNGKAETTEATTSAKGLMSPTDKQKLNGIQAAAEVNQNAFSGVNGVSATSKTDTLQIAGGTGITITEDSANKRLTVTATGDATPGAHASSHITGGTDVIPDAETGGVSGLMSGADAKFVRQEGETKTGAQAKADAAEQAANEYTDGKAEEVSAEVNQALMDANEYTDERISTVTANYIRQPGYAVTAGTATAYVATLDPVPTSLPAGFGITIVPHVASGASPTLNVNGLGAVALKKQDGSAYAAGDLKANTPYTFRKVGTDFLADSGGGEVKIDGQVEMTVKYGESIDKGVMVAGASGWNKLANPSSLPSASAYSVAYSSDGNYLAVAFVAAPYLIIYKRSGDTFTKLPDPAVLPTGNAVSASFSPNGLYLAVVHISAPNLTIYKRTGDTFIKLADPAVLPTSSGRGSFSPDGNYYAVAYGAAPYLAIYKRTGDVFTKLSNPAILPTQTGQKAIFSPDGTHLFVSYFASPWVMIYKRSGDTFTKIQDLDYVMSSVPIGFDFTTDGQYVAFPVSGGAGPVLVIFKRSGDTYSKLPDPSVLPTGTSRGVAFSKDMSLLAVGQNPTDASNPLLYKRVGDTFTKASSPVERTPGSAYDPVFSPDDNFLTVGTTEAPFIVTYKKDKTINKATLSNIAVGVDLIGYSLESGLAGENKKIMALLQ